MPSRDRGSAGPAVPHCCRLSGSRRPSDQEMGWLCSSREGLKGALDLGWQCELIEPGGPVLDQPACHGLRPCRRAMNPWSMSSDGFQSLPGSIRAAPEFDEDATSAMGAVDARSIRGILQVTATDGALVVDLRGLHGPTGTRTGFQPDCRHVDGRRGDIVEHESAPPRHRRGGQWRAMDPSGMADAPLPRRGHADHQE